MVIIVVIIQGSMLPCFDKYIYEITEHGENNDNYASTGETPSRVSISHGQLNVNVDLVRPFVLFVVGG